MDQELFNKIQDMVTSAKLPPEVEKAILQDVKDDGVLPILGLDANAKVFLKRYEEISLVIGPRDMQWDGETGKSLGAGTSFDS